MNDRPSGPLGAAREREHGQILVLFAFILIGLLLVSALAVDYGGWLLARRSYQNIADEAALAGSYLLTNPTGAACAQGPGISKQTCAREAAWQSIENRIGLPPGQSPDTLGDTPAHSLAVTWDGYTAWVASPPNDANVNCPRSNPSCVYTGLASSEKTVFVRVERVLQPGLSRIIQSSQTVGAWATAGRIAENFAIILLCQTNCLAGAADLQIAGANSNLVLESGDLGSNSYGHTGNNGAIALCEGSSTTSQCTAYMHNPSPCQIGSSTCALVGWDGTTVDNTVQYSAQALPQVVDPMYQPPSLTSTTTPYQCYSTLDSPPAVSSADQMVAQMDPYVMAAAELPPTPAPITLGAATATGQVTAAVGGPPTVKLNGVTVTLSPSSGSPNPATTAGSGSSAGTYTITGVAAGSYTLTASDSTNQYHTATASITVGASGTVTTNFALHKNPSFTGTVTDSVSGLPISGATVTFTGTGGPFTATTNASGIYTAYVSSPATSYTGTSTASNHFAGGPYTVTSGALDSASQTLNFSMAPSPGTISGTVSDASTSAAISGASVAISGVGTVITDATGHYTTGASAGSHTLQASATGYMTSSVVTVTLLAGGSVTQNFSLTPANATITGTVQDQTTGLPLAGATVTASNGVSTATSPPANASGVYTVSGLTPSNPRYTITASLSGYTSTVLTNKTVNAGSNTYDFTASSGNGLWPENCIRTRSGSGTGQWTCDTSCAPASDAVPPDVTCTAFDATNRIRPGTYKDITIGNGKCAWIDPLGGAPGVTTGQTPGVVYVTDSISIGSGAFLFGDGVTIVLGTGAHVDVNIGGGFIVNYKATSGAFANTWRTRNYIGGGNGTAQVFTTCASDTDGASNLSRAAITTGGSSHIVRYTWDTSGATPCYQDGDQGSYATTDKGEIGIAWYLKGTPAPSNSHRFSMSSQMGFLFDGVLYGPKDDIQLGGTSGQAAAGQIVAWTLKYNGDTNIYQRYGGIEVDGPPYLIEPYLGE